MPIYEYACNSCGNQFEVKQKFSDPPITSCEKCGESVRKLISAPGIMFKGTGWYVTDYSNKFKEPGQSTENQKDQKKKSDKKEGSAGEAKTGEGSSSGTPSPTKSEPGAPSTSSPTKSEPSAPSTSSSSSSSSSTTSN